MILKIMVLLTKILVLALFVETAFAKCVVVFFVCFFVCLFVFLFFFFFFFLFVCCVLFVCLLLLFTFFVSMIYFL